VGSFLLRVDAANVRILSGDDAPLWGSVWIDAGEAVFPESGWHDYIGSMFGSLVTALDGLSRGRPRGDAYFFNGSFTVQMVRKGWRWRDRVTRPGATAAVSYRMINDIGESGEVDFASEAYLSELIDDVHRSAMDALAAMKAIQSLTGPSLRHFQKNVEVLGKARGRLGRTASRRS
jgi:hypothetical protein